MKYSENITMVNFWTIVSYVIITLSVSLQSVIKKLPKTSNDSIQVTENLSTYKKLIKIVLKEIMEPKRPSDNLNTSQLIQANGFKAEEHLINSNGYLITIYRIKGSGPTVFLMHGMVMSSNNWLLLGNKSLPFYLATKGYDVWLGNIRGNIYGRRHVSLSPIDPKFWGYTVDEISTEDLPASIDYVCKTVGVSKLTYIGYSQGTTVMFILLSEKPEYNQKLLGFISLSTIAYMSNALSPAIKIAKAAKLESPIRKIFTSIGLFEVAPHRPPFSNLASLCASSKLTALMCMTLSYVVVGFDFEQYDAKHAQEQMRYSFSGCSLLQSLQGIQHLETGLFRKYDYGYEENMIRYGSRTPPSYALERITTNLSIIHGENDLLSNYKDVKKLIARLPRKPNVLRISKPHWNHLDYIYAKDANVLVYPKIEKFVKKYTS